MNMVSQIRQVPGSSQAISAIIAGAYEHVHLTPVRHGYESVYARRQSSGCILHK
jgi:uncharacterized protein YcsI (UPF0317 family)